MLRYGVRVGAPVRGGGARAREKRTEHDDLRVEEIDEQGDGAAEFAPGFFQKRDGAWVACIGGERDVLGRSVGGPAGRARLASDAAA